MSEKQTEATTKDTASDSKKELSGELLREQLIRTLDLLGITQRKLSRESDVNHTALNQWFHGKYPGDNDEIERRLLVWLRARPSRDAANHLRAPEWFSTPTAEKVLKSLQMCQVMANILCIYGGPGVGKTVTLNHFKRTSNAVWVATMKPSTASTVPALEEIAEAVGIRTRFSGARRISRGIYAKVEGTAGILIVDEAQHLSVSALEEIRAIHDATGIGLALVGNEAVYSRLTGGTRSSTFAQLFSRVGARLYLRKPVADDVEALAEAWKIGGSEEIEFLSLLASKPGALRSCTNTLKFAAVSREKGAVLNVQHLRHAWANLGTQE